MEVGHLRFPWWIGNSSRLINDGIGPKASTLGHIDQFAVSTTGIYTHPISMEIAGRLPDFSVKPNESTFAGFEFLIDLPA